MPSKFNRAGANGGASLDEVPEPKLKKDITPISKLELSPNQAREILHFAKKMPIAALEKIGYYIKADNLAAMNIAPKTFLNSNYCESYLNDFYFFHRDEMEELAGMNYEAAQKLPPLEPEMHTKKVTRKRTSSNGEVREL